MDFKSQALGLNEFLLTYKKFWEAEVLDGYPYSVEKYPQKWIDILWNLSIEEWHHFDSFLELPNCHDQDLVNYIQQIKNLSAIEKIESSQSKQLEDWAYVDMKFKKRHEINIMAPIIKKFALKNSINKVIDIGGGVGHLARTIAYYYGIETTSIDREKSFQETGAKRLSRYRRPDGAKDVHFSSLNFGHESDAYLLEKEMTKDSMTIGLHTCGPLANVVINQSIKYQNKGLLSFGCCYHKLNAKNDFKISNFYQQQNFIDLNLYAFTLASRAHCQTSFEDFKTKLQVKNYRQGLHLFLYLKLGIKDCFDVGEIHTRYYHEPFSTYVLSKLEQLNIKHNYSFEDIEAFYIEQRDYLKKMFICNLIRWPLGRCLEQFILIDRVLYLEEHGYEVDYKEYFDPTISPRNRGILAYKPR